MLILVLLALAVPAYAGGKQAERAMTTDEMISRLVAANEKNVDIIVKLKNGEQLKGYVWFISREYFTLWADGSRGTTIKYADAYSVERERRAKIVLRSVKDRFLVIITAPVLLPAFLIMEGGYFLFTGKSLPVG
jgi:hypothetical protein